MSSASLFVSSEAERGINEKEIQGHQRHRIYKYAQSWKGQIFNCCVRPNIKEWNL